MRPYCICVYVDFIFLPLSTIIYSCYLSSSGPYNVYLGWRINLLILMIVLIACLGFTAILGWRLCLIWIYILVHQVGRRLGQLWHFELWYALHFICTCRTPRRTRSQLIKYNFSGERKNYWVGRCNHIKRTTLLPPHGHFIKWTCDAIPLGRYGLRHTSCGYNSKWPFFELWLFFWGCDVCILTTIFGLEDFRLGTTDLQNEMLSHHSGKFSDFWACRM
jgi:hypothetical protein